MLKKAILVSGLFLISITALAPSRESIFIPGSRPIQPFKSLIHAIGMVETRHNPRAFNSVEQAVGIFQIRPIRLEDYNRRTGSTYKMKDLYKYEVSEKIFLYYASRIGPYDFERIARSWNGSGPKTHYYWKRVKKHLS